MQLVGKYDHTRPLIIDPVLTYFTYLGGKGNDYAEMCRPTSTPISPSQSIAADQAGNVYITDSPVPPISRFKAPSIRK